MEAGEDYRFQECEHPVKDLRCRREDNVDIGRVKNPEKAECPPPKTSKSGCRGKGKLEKN